MADLQILLVADDPLARAGLAALLSALPDCQVVDQMAVTDLAVGDWQEASPTLIVWDLGWGSINQPADTTADFSDIGLPIVALVPSDEDATLAWAAGAQALLPRQIELETLHAAIQAVAAGLIVLSADLERTLLPNRPVDDITAPELTPREHEVLQLVAEGLTNRAIAQRLTISEHTVKFHLNSVLGKLAAQSRTEAVVRATRLGLIVL